MKIATQQSRIHPNPNHSRCNAVLLCESMSVQPLSVKRSDFICTYIFGQVVVACGFFLAFPFRLVERPGACRILPAFGKLLQFLLHSSLAGAFVALVCCLARHASQDKPIIVVKCVASLTRAASMMVQVCSDRFNDLCLVGLSSGSCGNPKYQS
jgi:hypothetical protein